MPLAGQRNWHDNIDSHNNNLLNNLMMIIIILYAIYRDKVAIWECSKLLLSFQEDQKNSWARGCQHWPVSVHLNSLVLSRNQQKIVGFILARVYSRNWITRVPWASEVLSCPFLRLGALRFINILYQLVWNWFFFVEQCTFFPLSYMYINVIMTVFNQRCLLTFIFDQLHFNSVFF